ncbi:MAG: diaminopimelate decarboxylase [Actinomycetota bacterium]|nr:diaminopimelate decarboxylase [Actinomycetota bacterium]
MAIGPTRPDSGGEANGLVPLPSERPVARHLLPDSASVGRGGRLSLGGVDVLDLVEELGTPLFVYDAAQLRDRCAEAVAAFGPGVAYATKAFLCKEMARVAIGAGMSLDVSTAGELATVLAAGAPPERVVLHGNNKSDDELETAWGAGVGRVVVDSFDELERVARLAGSRERPDGSPQKVLVRVTPGVEAHTHEYVMTGQEDSKFGFSLASGAADRAASTLAATGGVELVGVHAHIGSQIFRLDAYERAVAALVPFVERHELAELCVGGGLGVAYVAGEEAPTISSWAAFLRSACSEAGLDPEVSVTAEPGRSVVATAAITCYRIGTVKELPGIRTYVAVDGGMSDNPRPVLYGSGYEAFLPRSTDAERPFAARVVGKHCESGDVLVAEARLPADVAVGDVLATPVTGAYGFSMSSNYNRVPRPAVVFVEGGSATVVVRRETVEDLLRLEP